MSFPKTVIQVVFKNSIFLISLNIQPFLSRLKDELYFSSICRMQILRTHVRTVIIVDPVRMFLLEFYPTSGWAAALASWSMWPSNWSMNWESQPSWISRPSGTSSRILQAATATRNPWLQTPWWSCTRRKAWPTSGCPLRTWAPRVGQARHSGSFRNCVSFSHL